MKKALVIDDNEEFVELLQLFLAKDFEITSCYNLEDINCLSSAERYDLVISDYNLGLHQGKEIIDVLKKRINTENSKLLLISGSVDTKLAAVELKADAFLEKPFKMTDLRNKLQELALA